MSQLSKIFQKVPVEVPKYSGFDLSHMNVGSLKVGTLTPVLVEPLYPTDRVSLGFNANFQLPPMATDFIGKVDVCFEAFFVPYRLCWQGWQKFYNNLNVDQFTTPVTRLPKLRVRTYADNAESILGAGSLLDYLGLKSYRNDMALIARDSVIRNPLPLLCYGLIYDRWYRDKVIQRPLFASPDEVDNMVNSNGSPFYGRDSEEFSAAMLPYRFGTEGVNSEYMNDYVGEFPDGETGYAEPLYADGSSIFELRQRNWAKDYFTVATPLPQAGSESTLEFTVVGNTGSFSIAALREANTLQKFAEGRVLAGGEYDSQIFEEWGIKPADAVLQHPILLGSQRINVYNRTVLQTANGTGEEEASEDVRNPFNSTVGASFGKSAALGAASLVDNFQAKEHGLLMVLASLVPHAFYSTGTRKYLDYNEFGDFPNPKLAGLGNQPIYQFELVSESYFIQALRHDTFGYADRFCERKFHNDEIHALLRDGENLSHFAVQRSFFAQQLPTISSDFIKIKQDAMDNVSAVANTISNYGAWYEIAWQEHITGAFPEYSIPTLGDDTKHTNTVMIDKGGKRL